MAGWHRLDPAARTPEAAARLLDQVWLHDGFRNDEQSELLAGPGPRDGRPATPRRSTPTTSRSASSARSATRTSVLAVSGRVDRLDHRVVDGHEQVVVVDYKTGRRLLTSYDARSSLALALYALAVTRTLAAAVRPRRAAPPAQR